ncbi:superoxide dismutase [Kushneria phosphatilytica]|uniref:Superoxide dismutase n=1 Tax=Kushneria phosphatilytica TaxID=657387 RepID=A0A1S1NWV0_9GAMM|nr:Fe-Mn family superoxide dismutase [Kushneria phosphatilytica]OHV11938.1 superoxide dismutase [Kushneria phosphatilytica]QEL11120.1 superoxide dismutase [Fe] [Kushneria phosphatilytica]
MAFELPPLPYAYDALQPSISEENLRSHHEIYHRDLLRRLDRLTAGTPAESRSLEELMLTGTGEIQACASQAWNHTFLWQCLSPWGGGMPKGQLAEAIKRQWGSFEDFQNVFERSALAHFQSGWTWLVRRADAQPDIVNISDAGSPLLRGLTPLLAIDMWEHAYYLDYRMDRYKYVQGFWKLANWAFAEQNLGA